MKNVLFDTNVILDAVLNRELSANAQSLFRKIETKEISGYITSGSIYTITYMLDKRLKQCGVTPSVRLENVRELMLQLITQFNVVDLNNNEFATALTNPAFTDLEDSYQYQAAISSGCDTIVTSNVRDFSAVQGPLLILDLAAVEPLL